MTAVLAAVTIGAIWAIASYLFLRLFGVRPSIALPIALVILNVVSLVLSARNTARREAGRRGGMYPW